MNSALTAIDGEAVAATVLSWLGQALLFGTALAALTWLIAVPLRRRMRPAFEAALWSIVLIKFLMPIGPQWSFSLASAWSAVSGLAPSVQADALGTNPAPESLGKTPAARSLQASGLRSTGDWKTIIAAAYVISVLCLLAIRVQNYRRWLARCRGYPPADERTHKLVRDVCQRLNVRRIPSIRISDESPSPFVMGFFRPFLVLPRHQLVRPNELETVVVHEVTHFRRGDLFVRLIQCIAGTLFFFWPIVAWVNRRIDAAREYACDEWALSHGKLAPGQYARCLLNAVRPLRRRPLAWQPACMAGSFQTLERRIDVILESTERRGTRPAWGLLAAAFILVWGGFALTGTAQDKGKASKTYLPTEQAMRLHAKEVYARVNQYAAGDQDGDGEVSKQECWSFITAAVLQQPEAVLKEYPAADHNQDGKLDMMEAYLFVRGDDVIKGLQEKLTPEKKALSGTKDEEAIKQFKEKAFAAEMDAWHFILDRRDQLLDMMSTEPAAAFVKEIADKAAELEVKEAKKGEQRKIESAIEEIAGLQAKAGELRAKAAELGGEKAAAYEAKAEQLEQKAADIRAKVTSFLEQQIAKLEAAGESEKAAKLKDQLAELESD